MDGKRGALIAVEGIDGAGKTTQVRLLAERLRSAGLSVVTTKEPTDGVYGQRLRASASTGRLPVEEELRLFLLDRREHVERLIRPSLDRREVVIVDRYYFSSAAYQGARGLDPWSIIMQNEEFAPRPDMLVHLRVPVSVSIERIKLRGNGSNHFENAKSLELCADIFDALDRTRDDQRHRPELLVIDGCWPVTPIHEAIVHRFHESALFRMLCFKPYLDLCEPEYCSYRLDKQCSYPNMGSLRQSSATPDMTAHA